MHIWFREFFSINLAWNMEKEMATHSSIFAWRIPGTEEPSGLPSMGLYRVGHDWSDLAAAAAAAADRWWLGMEYPRGLHSHLRHIGGTAGKAVTAFPVGHSLGFFTQQPDPKYSKVKAIKLWILGGVIHWRQSSDTHYLTLGGMLWSNWGCRNVM